MALERYAILSPVNNTYVGPDYSQIGLQYQVAKLDDWVFSVSASFFVPGASDATAARAVRQHRRRGGSARAGRPQFRGRRRLYVFVDAEVAYRDRTAGPPDEWHGDLTIGYKPNDKWTLMLQSFNEVTHGAGAAGVSGHY